MTHALTTEWVATVQIGRAEVEIDFEYEPGFPAAKVSFVSATVISPAGCSVDQAALDRWAAEYLRRDGYNEAVARVAECDELTGAGL